MSQTKCFQLVRIFYFEQGGITFSEFNVILNSFYILKLNHLDSEIPPFLSQKRSNKSFNILKGPHESPSYRPSSFPASLCAAAEISNYWIS